MLLGMMPFLFGCSSALKVTEVDSWLLIKAGSANPSVNVSGSWKDLNNGQLAFNPWIGVTSTGWGTGTLIQKDKNVDGNLDVYQLKGLVSGENFFFVLISSNAVYYMGNLKMLDNKKLFGNYYYPKDKELTDPYPMTLIKVD